MVDQALKILVPLDGSPASEAILPALMPLVARRPASLTLLEVIDRVDEIEAARGTLAETARSLKRDGVEAQMRLEFGHPIEEILHLAQPRGFDLVAMSTHGRSGLKRAFMGSVAEAVLRRSRIPTLLNRPGTKVGDWKRIVVPVDGTVASEAILEEACRLSRSLEATLHIVRVTLPLLPSTDMYFVPPPETMKGVQPYLDELCDRLATQGILAVPAAMEGFAGPEIVRYAREIDAGLIAMMTEGRSGFPRLLSGSVAEEVVRSATCPVLVRRWAAVEAESTA